MARDAHWHSLAPPAGERGHQLPTVARLEEAQACDPPNITTALPLHALSYSNGLLSEADDNLPALPRMRIGAAGDRRKHAFGTHMFAPAHPSQNLTAKRASGNSLSLERVNVLDDFNDTEIT